MKLLILLFLTNTFAFHVAAEIIPPDIISKMTDPSFGEEVSPTELRGMYHGVCYNGNTKTTESLYWNDFTNAKGKKLILGISTLQVYDGSQLPAHLEFLLSNSSKSWGYIENFVKNGLAGTDNNIGRVSKGIDFKYLYSSEIGGRTFRVTSESYRYCPPREFCNPPILDNCSYGYNENGMLSYKGCLRNNDITLFKKDTDGTLISHRKADGIGKRANKMSFYLEPISVFCRWQKD